MKKTYRRFFALLMCVVLILSLASVASAASVSWGDSEGGKTLTLTISESSYQRVAVSNPRTYEHTTGTATNILLYGLFTATIDAEYTNTNYVTRLVEAMNLEGVLSTYTTSGRHTSPLTVPADEPSGNYTLGVLFDTKTGYWGVSTGMLAKSTTALNPIVESGTLYYAPRGSVYGYVVMPVP